MEWDPKYFGHEHQWITVEDLKIDGEKEAICMACEEPSSKPYIKCSICSFHCHQSCEDLPEDIEHPLHPIHQLHARPPNRSVFCDACGKCCKRCFFYTCNDCNFNLDYGCSSRWRGKKDDGHQHVFVPGLKENQFTCELCGEEGKDVRCMCSICQLLVHSKCASFLPTINIIPHSHSLVLKYPSTQVKEQADAVCKLCSLKMTTKSAYYCQQCSYAAHLTCARDCQFMEDKDAISDSTSTDISQWFTGGYVTGLIKDINSEVTERSLSAKIKHSSHQHDLILNYEEVSGDKVCDGCMQVISIPFYSCAACNFTLHYLCANLPTSIRHLNAPWTFNLVSHLPSSDGVFQCGYCGYYRHGFPYRFKDDKFSLDIQCLALQHKFRHKGHQHTFSWTQRNLWTRRENAGCKFCEMESLLTCFACNFNICNKCATFPLEAKYKDDDHILKLTYAVEDESQEYYCQICEKERDQNHWFYYCVKCNFATHPQCVLGKYLYIKFGITYEDEEHEHPLTFIKTTEDSSLCDICEFPFNGVALHCKECKLNIHPRFEYSCQPFSKLM